MAQSCADVLRSLGDVTAVDVVGGGVQSEPFLEALTRRSALVIRRGAVEATALGNAMVQGVALQ